MLVSRRKTNMPDIKRMPVAQLSVDSTLSPKGLYGIGEALAPLRDGRNA